MRILFVAAAALAASAAVAQQTPSAHLTLPDGPGKAQVTTACAGCHDLSVVTAKHYSAARWDEVVGQMVSRGAPVADADYDAVVAYLAKNYGEPAPK